MGTVDKCHVCGDEAFGYNYNGFTCVSCRTFFIRSAKKPTQKLKCPKQDNCSIDIGSRKACPSCRLKKCIAIGMQYPRYPSPAAPPSEKPTSVIVSPKNVAAKYFDSKLFDILNATHEQFDNNTFDSLDSFYASRKRNYAIDLNFVERSLIAEIQDAMEVFIDERTLPELRQSSQTVELISWPKAYPRKVIKFFKNIRAFSYFRLEDQHQILRQSFLQILFIRACFNFDPKRCGFPVMENEYGINSIFLVVNDNPTLNSSPGVTEFNVKYTSNLNYEMQNDVTIRNLIIGQFLFRSQENLACPEFARQQYFLYTYLLRRYLEHKFKHVNQALKKLTTIMNLLDDLNFSIEQNRFVLGEVDLEKLEHFLIELYGLDDEIE